MSDVAAASAQAAAFARSTAPRASAAGLPLWSHGSFSFKDLLDIINPLQHLPVIGSIYRYLTGDEPSGGARIVGDSLYGGPIGLGVGLISTAFLTDSHGRDVGEQLLADVFGSHDESPSPATPALASAAAASAGPAAASSHRLRPLLIPSHPVAMNHLFRSPPPAPPATPKQQFLAQQSRLQREIANHRGTDGTVLNNHPVPLELSSGLLPTFSSAAPPPARPAATAAGASPAIRDPGPARSRPPGAAALASNENAKATSPAAPNPLAQQMLEALDKYEQLKRQQEQLDGAALAPGSRVKLAL